MRWSKSANAFSYFDMAQVRPVAMGVTFGGSAP